MVTGFSGEKTDCEGESKKCLLEAQGSFSGDSTSGNASN